MARVSIPGSVVRLLREGSFGADRGYGNAEQTAVRDQTMTAIAEATVIVRGYGRSHITTLSTAGANLLADYLWSVVGVWVAPGFERTPSEDLRVLRRVISAIESEVGKAVHR